MAQPPVPPSGNSANDVTMERIDRQSQRKSAPKLGPIDTVVSLFSNLGASDQATAPKRDRTFSPPRQPEIERPLSPIREGQDPVGRTIERLLALPTQQEREKRFRELDSETRRNVRKKLKELVKDDEPPKPAPTSPTPKQATIRERPTSLDKFSLRLFSPPRVRESVTSPPRTRATSPTPSQKNVRRDDKEKQPLSPHRQRELSPPLKQTVSPRKSQRPTSPTPDERIAGLRQRSSSQATVEPIARPQSPPKARIVEPPRVYKSDLSTEQLSRAKELLQYYAALKVDSRKRALLSAIEANNYDPKAKRGEEKPVWDLLALANESVIPTNELFEIIQKSLAKPREEEIQAKRVKSYLNFSLTWLAANKQTKLFEKALPYLAEIARLALLHSDAECKALAERLQVAVTAPLELLVRQPLSRTSSVSNHEFEMIIKEITSGSIDKPFEALADLVSLDLFFQLKQLYQAMNAHDLMEKWPAKKNKPAIKFINFFNAFSGFIIDTLLQKNLTSHQRACIIKFFVHVAFKSTSLGDLTTPMMVIAALDNTATKKLQAALRLLNNDTFDIGFLRKVQGDDQLLPERVTTLGAIEMLMKSFDPLRNWRKVRNLQAMFQEQKQFFIPYIPLIFSDLEFVGQNSAIIERENSYNFDKLQQYHDKTAQLFACRDMPVPGRITLEAFQTDLFVKVIKESSDETKFVYPNMLADDDARYKEALARNTPTAP